MKTIYIKILYYTGHLTYLFGLKYWYIPGAYSVYNWCMNKSSELDVDNKVWGKPLARPEKDDI